MGIGGKPQQPVARILVVDDDPAILRLIEFYLQREGYTVATAKSGMEALNLADKQDFDLAVLDVMMPGIDGLEVCRVLRERERTANLPIIILSALGQVQDKVKGLRSGGDEYVTKPIELEELGARIAALLDRTQRLQQAARPARQGRVIGFLGARGGVGTTTVALNVASALVQQKKTVIAAELRPGYGSFAAYLKATPRAGLPQLCGLEPEQVTDRQIRSHLYSCSAGFAVLYGPQNVEEYRDLPAATVEALVQGLSCQADFVVADLPAYPGHAAHAAARACSVVVLVVEPEPACIHAGRAALEVLRAWGISGSGVAAVIVNRAGLSLNIHVRDMRSQLGCEIVGMIPRAGDPCVAAQERGGTLVSLKSEHLATNTLIELGGRLAADPVVGIRM